MGYAIENLRLGPLGEVLPDGVQFILRMPEHPP